MTETATAFIDSRPRRSRMVPLFLAVAALVAGAGAFFATYGGHLKVDGLLGGKDAGPVAKQDAFGFVPVPPLLVSLGPAGDGRHLRFSAQIEASEGASSEIERLMPRIVDVINAYLRAVDVAELENPTALVRLRAQMLRRVQIVAGRDQVRDLLITEFVLS